MTCVESNTLPRRFLPLDDYDLAATLDSGQAFRWRREGEAWTGVVGDYWVRLRQQSAAEPRHWEAGSARSPDSQIGCGSGILAETVVTPGDWRWLASYLQTDVSLSDVLSQLPRNRLLNAAIKRHHGLRILRQDPWECLATFILSSTKQIVQIRQIVESLCRDHGEPIPTPDGFPPHHRFPTAQCVAALTETELRQLKMGFRAPYLLEAAKQVNQGVLDLEALRHQPLEHARQALMALPGVGRKIADCVLLFSLGFDAAFPVDVWVTRALSSEWFNGKKVRLAELVEFSASHFGPYGGYAQQYLFHHMRTPRVTKGRGK